MRIGIVYTDITSYMTDCWRELASIDGVALKIWIEERENGNTDFNRKKLLEGLNANYDFSNMISYLECDQVVCEIKKFNPDIVFVCGWSRNLPPYVAAAKELSHIPMVLEFDMPWEWRLRKIAARFILGPRLKRFSAAFVPGESTARYARWLGFKPNQIYRGKYAIDLKKWENRTTTVQPPTLPSDPWPLDVYGCGPEEKYLRNIPGITLHGFAQPEDLPRIYREHHTLLLFSKWEPWGVVAMEALAAGCKVVCSKACGVKELVDRISCVEDEKGRDEILKEYSCEAWADRVLKICNEVIK